MSRTLTLGLALAATGALTAAPAAAQEPPGAEGHGEARADVRLEMAREESGVELHPRTRFALPAGELDLSAAEFVAASRATLRFTVRLDRRVADGRLELTLPSRWAADSAVSDLPFARVPGGDRTLGLSFADGAVGEEKSVAIRDVGIPAGTYRVAYRWTEPGKPSSSGAAQVIFFAPVREADEGASDPSNPWARLTAPGLERNVTDDALPESETFVSVVPGDPQRFLVGANGGGGYNGWITNDGGQTFSKAPVSASVDAPAEAGAELASLCCDPMSAADAGGNLWYGGLTLSNGPGNPSRIIVARSAPGATTFVNTVGLKQRTSGTQDKPMMTIDNAPSSPTWGMLYVVWDEPSGGGINIVVSRCNTRPGGVLDAANCDNADSWSAPVSITKATGSYIYADVAVGPDGNVYVVWWDYSSANAIRGATCTSSCDGAANWSVASTIATLDATGGVPLPFACPIVAQPGGRASTAPGIEVDRSGGPHNNRVWVSWSDLRTGSGTTRCAGNLTPSTTHLTFDSFVVSAVGAIPGGASPSPAVATRLLTDGDDGGQSNSDDWFPWIAVDQSNGKVWADFYSTREDSTRRTTKLYMRTVRPRAGGGSQLGALITASSSASDYSAATCCTFGNDYGDYTGIDATADVAIPVWSNKQSAAPGPDGEAFAFVTAADATAPETSITAGPAEGSTTADNTPTFSFTATEAGSTFECRVDVAAFAPCSSPLTLSSLSDGAHTFQVRATDPAANTDATPASRSFTVDTTAPETSITAGPAEGSTTADNTPTFAFTATEAGSTFECRVDGASFAACSSQLTTAALGDGAHTFHVQATDGAGNTDQSPAMRSFTVDTTAPETAITGGPADGGVTNDSTPTLAFSASEANITFECRVDGASFAACSSQLTTAVLGDGGHRFDVRAIDGAGNVDASPGSRSFTVDTVAPDTTITSGPDEGATITDPTATFGLASSEAGATLECRVDESAFAACGSPFTSGALAPGSHTFFARSTDAAGNTDASPVSRAFTMQPAPSIGTGRVKTARATRKRVVVLGRPRLSCPGGPVACRVSVRATAVLRGAQRSRIGSSARTLAAGRAGRVRFTLTRAGYRALVRRGRLRARVKISMSLGSQRRSAALSVTLLRPR